MANDDDTVPVPEVYRPLVTYHGRDFQEYAIDNNVYYAPVDEDEADRLRLMHGVFKILFDNRLIFPPIRGSRLRNVLDCGYGAGWWVLDVAAHPDYNPDQRQDKAEGVYGGRVIIGVDISDHMAPTIYEDTFPNVYLLVDNLNLQLNFDDNHFDLVNSQMMAGGIDASRWPTYIRDILRVLRPGGWCQMVEIYFNAQSSNDTLGDDHGLRRWSRRYLDILQQQNKDPRIGMRLYSMMRDAGFRDVERQTLTLPMCPWSTDPRERDIGIANQPNVSRLLGSLALYPFTAFRNMSIAEFHLLVQQARREAENPQFKPYFTVYVCVGRKSRH